MMSSERGCALVTGAARGIGAAAARMLAADGWPVGVNYRSYEHGAAALVKELETFGFSALAVQGDVTSQDDVERLFQSLEDRYGRVAVLVNNAGVTADGLSATLRDEQWHQVLDTNLSGTFRTCRRALMPMVKARFGRIINLASIVGPNMGNPGQSNYAAAKAGIVGMTSSIAREVARRGVTVNAIAPGFVATQMTADLDPGIFRSIPAQRAATPEEIAAAVRFLASDDAAYITGTTLTVDGGMTA
jgi:3-oxoacyl-[acyl-carrier protein] reductase